MVSLKNQTYDERGKILGISVAIPSFFANPYASKSYHISLQKIA
jgi:hypothetical protein